MSIRRLNYTKRRPLTRKQVRICLSPGSNGQPRTFDAELQLPSGLPGDARIFIEAYRSSPAARMRFDWGTVDKQTPASDRQLLDFHDDGRLPLFRVKVTDVGDAPGKLLAGAHQIRPVDPDETPDKKRGILLTDWGDNGGLVWDLNLTDSRGPLLIIDKYADPHHELPGQLMFKALVFPEIIRRVLTEILINDSDAMEDDENSWRKQWLTFPRMMFGFADELNPNFNEEEKQDWINDAVKACALKAKFCADIAPPKEDE